MTVQERALDYSLLIEACNKNDRENMHINLGNLMVTDRLSKYKDRLLTHLDERFSDVVTKNVQDKQA